MSEEEKGDELLNIPIEPKNELLQNVQTTITADFCKVLIDHELQTCTFVFFQRHPKPKLTDRGIEIEGLHEQSFLEVKMPFSTSFAMALYMNQIVQEIRQKNLHKGFSWGPTSIRPKK